MPDDKSNLYRAIHYSGAPDSAIMRAEEEAELAAESEAEAMREGRVEERTLFTWLDRNRGRLGPDVSLREITVSLASLLLLRWLEAVEEEAAAIAEFEGADYERSLLPTHTLSHWTQIPAERLKPYLNTVIIPELKRARGTEYSVYANRLVVGIEGFSRLEPSVQVDLIRHVVAIEPGDPLGRMAGSRLFETVQEWQLRKAKSTGGEYRTPFDLAWLMAKLADPAPTDRVYDPCFGGGNLLVEAAHRKRAHTSKVDSELWARMQRNGIYGREIDPTQYLIGLVRVVYSGIDLPRLELGDSLETTTFPRANADASFDCIVANPPFGLRMAKRIGDNYPIPMVEGEGLFLQHIVNSLRPGGRAVVLVSPGLLSNEGRWAKLREFLIASNFVDQVVALPAGLLKPYTMIAPSLLVLRKGRRGGEIRFSRLRAPKPSEEGLVTLSDDEDDDWKEEFFYNLSVEECAKRGYDLRVRDLSSKGVEERIRELAERFPEVELHKLGRLCEVIPGVARKSSDTTPNRAEAGANPIGLLRISDVVKGEIREPALYLLPGSPQLEKVKARLQPGDLLLSTKGTIGRLAVAPDLPSPVYAAEGLTILRLESPSILRDYVFAMLNSETYREFLAGMSSGTTLQHVRHTDVRNLPVPVPPLPIQDRVCQEILGTERDALITLSRLLERGEENPFTEWLEDDPAIRALLEFANSSGEKDRLRILEDAAVSIQRISRSAAEQSATRVTDFAGDLSAWFRAIAEATSGFKGITRLESVADQFEPLIRVRTLSMVFDLLLPGSESGLARRAKQVGNAFKDLVEAETTRILKAQTVSIDCPETVSRDKPAVVTVTLFNHGMLPFRDVTVTHVVSGVETRVPNWAPRSSLAFDETVHPENLPDEDAFESIGYRIEATLPGGSDWIDELYVPVFMEDSAPWLVEEAEWEVEPSITASLSTPGDSESHEPSDLGPSPYNAGSPVKNEAMLFGRDPILRLVQRQLAAKDRPNVVLLEGNRRTGKTSILKRLEKGDLLPEWIVVYCSFQEAEGSEVVGLRTSEIWRLLAKNIGLALLREGYEPPIPGDDAGDPAKPVKVRFTHSCREAFKSDHPFEIFEEFLQECLDMVAPKRLVLMLDEFDKLQDGIISTVTSPQVPENLRYLIHDYPAFGAILTGSRRLKTLREEYWSALFGLGHQVSVSSLPHGDAIDLVVKPVVGQLDYHPDAAEEIVRATDAQPFLIQGICNRIYDAAAESGRRRINLHTVKEAIDTFVAGSEHFRHSWGAAETARRRLILSLIQRAESDREGTPMTLPLLEQTLAELKVPIPRSHRIADDLNFLREFEMIRLVGVPPNQHYEIVVPLFGRWIAEQEDFDDIVRLAIEEGENATK